MTVLAWIIPPLILLAGRMVWTRLPCGVEKPADALEDAFASVLCGVFVAGLLGLLLAECGILRPALLVGGLAAVSVGFWRRSPARVPVLLTSRQDLWAAAFVCGLAMAVGSPASEDLLGGRDPGVYANTGSWLAREGTLRIRADALARLPADARPLFYDASGHGSYRKVLLLGFFVTNDGAAGEIEPQALHLFPVYLAIGDWLGGPTFAFLVPPLFGALAALAVFLFARRLLGPGAALVAVAVLVLNLAQIWAVRNPLTEGATQLGIFAALWCISRSHATDGMRWGVLGGLALGTSLLLRVDSLLLVPALVPALLILHASSSRTAHWLTRAFLPIAVLCAIWATAHGWVFSRTYIRDLSPFLAAPWVLTVVVLVMAIPLLMAPSRFASFSWVYRKGRALWSVTAVVLAAAFVFGMWVRPHLEPFRMLDAPGMRSYDEETLVRVGWYLSVPGMLGALTGLLLLLYRWLVRRRDEWAPFLFVLVAFSCLYFWRQLIFPDHPWAMRRYLPVIVPGACVAIAAIAQALWNASPRRWPFARTAAVALVGFVLWHEAAMARPFWDFREKRGVIAAIDRVARLIPPDAIVLFTAPGPDVQIATPLAVHRGRSVLPVVRRPGHDGRHEHRRHVFETQIAGWMRAGRQVVYLASQDGDAPYATENVRWESLGTTQFTVRTFGGSDNHPPRAPISHNTQYHVVRAVAEPNALPPCAPRAQRADTVLLGMAEGFHQLETRRSVRYRWLRPHARLVFPPCERRTSRPRLLRVRATCGPRPRKSGCRVDVWVNSAPAGELILTDQWTISDLLIPEAAAAGATGAFDIRFSGPRFVPAEAGMGTDRRELSFRLASVALVPAASLESALGTEGTIAEPPPELNLISLAAQDIWGVKQDGFHDVERSDGRMFRWTERRARLVVPLGRSRPTAIRVEVSRTVRPGQPIRISANGCPLFDGVPPRNEWVAVLRLDACPFDGDVLTIGIESNAIRPGRDARELAVAVRSIQAE